MNFELSSEHLALRDRARAFAAGVQPLAEEIDRSAAVPPDLAQRASALCDSDLLTLVVALEEIAAGSAALAVVASGDGTAPLGLTGLRGATALPERSARSQLTLAATAIGIGKSALDAALADLRRSSAAPAADVEKPHWVVADAATELEAARLLTYKAARSSADADIAIARLMSSTAAERCVDAALRVVGPSALQPGSALERLARDVRAVALVLGTEEHQRAVAAEGLLPR